jgi:hypothetical protein
MPQSVQAIGNQRRTAVKVYAVHNGLDGGADATAVDSSNHVIQRSNGTITGLTFAVDLDGAGGTQTMRLRVSSSAVTCDFRARRHNVNI